MITPVAAGGDVDMVVLPPAIAVTVPPGDFGAVVFSGRCILVGTQYTVLSAISGDFATFYDGSDNTGQPVMFVMMDVAGVVTVTVPGGGVMCNSGVYASSPRPLPKAVAFVIPLLQ